MINYEYRTDFKLLDESFLSDWIEDTINFEGFELGEINYTFVSDEELHEINLEYLNHDTFTDIISFDYTVGKLIQGEIFISIDRVKENALSFDTDFLIELHRVIIHGVLHYCGFKDKTEDEVKMMRSKEDFHISRLGL